MLALAPCVSDTRRPRLLPRDAGRGERENGTALRIGGGVGQFGTPWERMHRLKRSMLISSCGISPAGYWSLVPPGSSSWHALSAA